MAHHADDDLLIPLVAGHDRLMTLHASTTERLERLETYLHRLTHQLDRPDRPPADISATLGRIGGTLAQLDATLT